ncbi:hypothetical protein D3C86_1469820 [compost metagenome]
MTLLSGRDMGAFPIGEVVEVGEVGGGVFWPLWECHLATHQRGGGIGGGASRIAVSLAIVVACDEDGLLWVASA